MAEQNPMVTLQAELSRFRRATLNSAVKDTDKLLELLIQAREQVANGMSLAPLHAAVTGRVLTVIPHPRSAPGRLDDGQATEPRYCGV